MILLIFMFVFRKCTSATTCTYWSIGRI